MSLMDAWKSVEQENEPINQETVSDPIDGKGSLWRPDRYRFGAEHHALRGSCSNVYPGVSTTGAP